MSAASGLNHVMDERYEDGDVEGIDWSFEPYVPPTCPACVRGVGELLGALGRLTWHRCRDCGIDFHTPADQED